jgi:hypothetical protein
MDACTEERLRALEDAVETGELDVEAFLERYKKEFARPHWQLVQDIERQALIHYNIIEALKDGKTPQEIKRIFAEAPEPSPDHDDNPRQVQKDQGEPRLGLVPSAYLPNPHGLEMLRKAFDKLERYREALIQIVLGYGAALLKELSVRLASTATVSVNLGVLPSVSVGIEYTAEITAPNWA